MIFEFLSVGVGGFIGSCVRFTFSKLSNYFNLSFPFGTLISNVIAGIAIGFILGIEQQSVTIPPKFRLFITTGVLGGLSTFSTFSAETVLMFNNGKYILASGNILLNLCLSLFGVIFGIFIAKTLFGNNPVVHSVAVSH